MPLVVAIVLGVLFAGGAAVALATSGKPAVGSPPAGSAAGVPAEGVGGAAVVLSADALGHPAALPVRDQLQRYFDAINARDYAAWRATVVPERAAAMPEAAFRKAYATTKDGSVRIDRIDDVPGGGAVVRVRFVSTQDPADAPPDARAPRLCWRSSIPMTGGPPRVDRTRGGSSVAQPC